MSYAIAAYGLVIGTLVVYGLRVEAQRRALERAARREAQASGEPT